MGNVPQIQESFSGVVRIGVAVPVPFNKGLYEVREMGSGVLLEVDGEPIVMTSAHEVLDKKTGWTTLKHVGTKIFIGVYRAPELASRWMFEANVESLLISAKHNNQRKEGPITRVEIKKLNESDSSFRTRLDQERPVNGIHDIAVMTLLGMIELKEEIQIVDAYNYGGSNKEEMIPITMTEGKVGEQKNDQERKRVEHDLKFIQLKLPVSKSIRQLSGNEAKEIIRNTPTLSCLPYRKTEAGTGTVLKLLGWPVAEYVSTETGDPTFMYAGSIFAADGTIENKYDNQLLCDLRNYKGGSGGPALDEQNQVVGILSLGNDNRKALVVSVHHGLSLVMPMLKKLKSRSGGGGGAPSSSTGEEKKSVEGGGLSSSIRTSSAAELAAGNELLLPLRRGNICSEGEDSKKEEKDQEKETDSSGDDEILDLFGSDAPSSSTGEEMKSFEEKKSFSDQKTLLGKCCVPFSDSVSCSPLTSRATSASRAIPETSPVITPTTRTGSWRPKKKITTSPIIKRRTNSM